MLCCGDAVTAGSVTASLLPSLSHWTTETQLVSGSDVDCLLLVEFLHHQPGSLVLLLVQNRLRQTVRCGGVVLLLGVGSVLCYRLLRRCVSCVDRSASSSNSSSSSDDVQTRQHCGAGDRSSPRWPGRLVRWLLRWRRSSDRQALLQPASTQLVASSQSTDQRVQVHYFGPELVSASQSSPGECGDVSVTSPLQSRPPRRNRRWPRRRGFSSVLFNPGCNSGVGDVTDDVISPQSSLSPCSQDSVNYHADHSRSLSADEQALSDSDCTLLAAYGVSHMGNTDSSQQQQGSAGLRSGRSTRHRRRRTLSQPDYEPVVFRAAQQQVSFTRLPHRSPPPTSDPAARGRPSFTVGSSSQDYSSSSTSPGQTALRRRVVSRRVSAFGNRHDDQHDSVARLQRRVSDAAVCGGSVQLNLAELDKMRSCCGAGGGSSLWSDLSLDLADDASLDLDLSVATAAADSACVDAAAVWDQLMQQLDVLKRDVSCLDSQLVTLHFPDGSPPGTGLANCSHTTGSTAAAAGGSGRRRLALSQLGRSQSDYRVSLLSAAPPVQQSQSVVSSSAAAATLVADSTTTDASLEWDSPVHGWCCVPRNTCSITATATTSVVPAGGARRLLSRSQSLLGGGGGMTVSASSLLLSAAGDGEMPSLEWDHTGVVQYSDMGDEQDAADSSCDVVEDGVGEAAAASLSLELDMETELAQQQDDECVPRVVGTGIITSTPSSRPDSLILSSSGCLECSASTRLLSDSALTPGVDTSSGYEGMDSSGVMSRTPLSPVTETPLERRGVGSSDSVLSLSCSAAAGTAVVPSCAVSQLVADNETTPASVLRVRRRRRSTDAARVQAAVSSDISPSPPPRHHRDSAYCDDGLDGAVARAGARCSVSEPLCARTYSRQEWGGGTARATNIRRGYEQLEPLTGHSHVQLVRGDNYCALRAALFQQLVAARPLPDTAATAAYLAQAQQAGWLQNWSFACRLSFSSVAAGIDSCLDSLQQLADEAELMSDSRCDDDCVTRRRLIRTWNSDADREVQALEALKLHMLATSLRLYERMQHSQDVNEYVPLLFARETSADPEMFMLNHLNHAGDSAGLEQVEMCLLADTLSATVRVLRPSCYGQPDFITYYPPSQTPAGSLTSCVGARHLLTLIAEDDRHYNIACS